MLGPSVPGSSCWVGWKNSPQVAQTLLGALESYSVALNTTHPALPQRLWEAGACAVLFSALPPGSQWLILPGETVALSLLWFQGQHVPAVERECDLGCSRVLRLSRLTPEASRSKRPELVTGLSQASRRGRGDDALDQKWWEVGCSCLAFWLKILSPGPGSASSL